MSFSKDWDNNNVSTGLIEQSTFTRKLNGKIIESIPSNPQKVLDVRCGNGVLKTKIKIRG